MLKRLKIDKNGTHGRVDGDGCGDDDDEEAMRFTAMFIDHPSIMTMAVMASQMPKMPKNPLPTLRGNIQPICVVGLVTLLMTTIALVCTFGGICI